MTDKADEGAEVVPILGLDGEWYVKVPDPIGENEILEEGERLFSDTDRGSLPFLLTQSATGASRVVRGDQTAQGPNQECAVDGPFYRARKATTEEVDAYLAISDKAKEFLAEEKEAAGKEFPLAEAYCCSDTEGQMTLTHVTDGVGVCVDSKGGAHVVALREGGLKVTTLPPYKRNVPPSALGVRVLPVLNTIEKNHIGIPSVAKEYVTSSREILIESVVNGEPAVNYVMRWYLMDQVIDYVPTRAGDQVYVIEAGDSDAVDQVLTVDGWDQYQPFVTLPSGRTSSVRRWINLTSRNPNPSGQNLHEGHVLPGQRVFIMAAKESEHVGKIGLSKGRAGGTAGREVEVDLGEGVTATATEWYRVNSDGDAETSFYPSLMTDEEAEAALARLYEEADKAADKQQWCNEYDYLMQTEGKRPPATIRQFAEYEMEVEVTFDPDSNQDESVFRPRSATYVVRAKGGNVAQPHTAVARQILEESGMKDILSISTSHARRV